MQLDLQLFISKKQKFNGEVMINDKTGKQYYIKLKKTKQKRNSIIVVWKKSITIQLILIRSHAARHGSEAG